MLFDILLPVVPVCSVLYTMTHDTIYYIYQPTYNPELGGTYLLRWTEGYNESGSLFVSLPSPCWWCWVVAGAGCWHIVNKSWRRSSPSVCRAVTHQPDLGTDIRNPPTVQKKVGKSGSITEGGYISVFSSCVMRWNEANDRLKIWKARPFCCKNFGQKEHFVIIFWLAFCHFTPFYILP